MEQADKKVFTLTQLGMAFENHVMDHFGSKQLWVVAEITKISVKSGHRYLELVDSAENLTTAQFSAYMWSRNFIAIKEQLGAEINEIFKPGNKALFLVKIEFHKVYGLKLNILSVDPQYTYGEIERRKKETLGRLSKEGLIDLQKSLYFPTLTKRIALVGSPNTSGFRDFKEVLFNNPVFRRFKLKQFSTSVQGDKAKDEIIAAIKKARCYDLDVIVLIRGGGSKMDLDIFNNYEICREICLTQIPVLTGIGHETDQVVADRVAHQFFITPTAVAKHLYVQIGNFSYFLNKYFDQVKTRSLEQLGLAKDEFQYQNKYLVHHTKEIINTWKDVFNEKAYRLGKNSQRLIHHEREELSNLRYKTHRELNRVIQESLSDLERKKGELKFFSTSVLDHERTNILYRSFQKTEDLALHFLDHERVNIQNKEQLVELLNPEKILKAGYTISTVDEKDVFELQDVVGKEMKTLTSKSLIISKIVEIQNTVKNE